MNKSEYLLVPIKYNSDTGARMAWWDCTDYVVARGTIPYQGSLALPLFPTRVNFIEGSEQIKSDKKIS